MVKGFYNDVVRMITEIGYYKIKKGGKGSHEKWAHETLPTVTVPHNMLSKHTANGILKDAGLTKLP
ncbi:type II toxin-antitoxin system HicA family toxin [Tateyamaria sp.]|uniref:type II toxin-antitoxin system HicA family toxin n=1 Tax=Tateyamaria sp. TaxID=1929288 RepID=UPI0039B850A2